MKTSIMRLVVVIIALLLLTTGCQRRQAANGPDAAALEIAVHDAFTANPDAKGATSGVQVSAKNGTITLSGTADTAADKARAEEIARRTAGVIDVVNQIVVNEPTPVANAEAPFDEKAVRAEAARSGEELGPSSTDAQIYKAVRRKLVADPATPKMEIFVDVVNGNVTLRGMVFTSKARKEAVTLARKVPGVNAVNDNLLVNTTIP